MMPQTCFYTSSMHLKFLPILLNFFLKSVTFLYNHLKFCFVSDTRHRNSPWVPDLRLVGGKRSLTSASHTECSQGRNIVLWLNSVNLQSRSFLSLFQAASLKTNNFPLILRGKRSLHLFLLQLFLRCVTETESLHLNKSLDGWIGDVK